MNTNLYVKRKNKMNPKQLEKITILVQAGIIGLVVFAVILLILIIGSN